MFGLSSGTNMRGLNEFISDIRACKDTESQGKRVDEELAKIRGKFTTEKGLSAYHRKKYVWKLLYIHILGYQVDFGYDEAIGLINSSKYDEKYTGYIASGMLIKQDNTQIWRNIVHSIKSDLIGRNESNQVLACSLIASLVPQFLVRELSDSIIQVATGNHGDNVRKRAIMCLGRILKKYPQKYDPKQFLKPIIEIMQKKSNSLSLLNSCMSFLLICMSLSNPDSFIACQKRVIQILHKLAINKQCSSSYIYYSVPSPWLQMKLYKTLQIWDAPTDKGQLAQVSDIITKVIKRTDSSKSVNKNNVEYGLLFEVINLVIKYDRHLQRKIISDVSKILAVFITSSQANIRYLGLQAMCRLAIKEDLSSSQGKILSNLDARDISIRKRALDLLYLICNSSNAEVIVAELLGYLQCRNDPLIRDDLVLKIAILSQKFAENLKWYVDVVVKLIQNAQVQNDIWYSIIQIISGFGSYNQQLQEYATKQLYKWMSVPHVTETMRCVGAYILAQFSQCLVKYHKEPKKILDIIYKHFQPACDKSKAMMLNAFAKLGTNEHQDPDIQQRGVQFLVLFNQDTSIKKKVVALNPAFTEEQQLSNPLIKKFAKGATKATNQSKIHSTVKQSKVDTNYGGATSHPLFNHPCFKKAVDRLSPNILNLLDVTKKLELQPYWQEAFVKKTPFEQCEVKQKLQNGVLKVILTVHVKTSQMQFKIFRSKGFDIGNSPIKYTQENQQILLTLTPNGDKIEPPVVGVAWNNGGVITKKQLQLPIAITKFLSPVDLPYEKFNSFYKNYSLPNKDYFKIDAFLKTPQNTKGVDQLRKVGSFFKSLANFTCSGNPSMQNLQTIYGSASFPLQQDGKVVNSPILVEAEAYTVDNHGYWRISLRGGNANVLESLHETFLTFFA